MKNPNNNSIIYIAQNEQFFTILDNYDLDQDIKILADVDNVFVKCTHDNIQSILEAIIELKYIHHQDFPKHINIKTIVNV